MKPELKQHLNNLYKIEYEKKESLTNFLFNFFFDMCSGSKDPLPVIIRVVCTSDGQEDVGADLFREPATSVFTISNSDNTCSLGFGSHYFDNDKVITSKSIPKKLNPHITDLDISIIKNNGDHIVYPVDYVRFHDNKIEIIHNTYLRRDNNIVNPEVFTERMKEAVNMSSETNAHEEADHLMAELLIQLGYKEAVDMFFHLNRYY